MLRREHRSATKPAWFYGLAAPLGCCTGSHPATIGHGAGDVLVDQVGVAGGGGESVQRAAG